MHGWIPKALEDFVTTSGANNLKVNTGEVTDPPSHGAVRNRKMKLLWQQILEETKCVEPDSEKHGSDAENNVAEDLWGSSNSIYPDELTYRLLKVTSEKFSLEEPVLLERLGRHFITFSCMKGFDALMRCQGRSLLEFLGNVGELHSHLAFAMHSIVSASISDTTMATADDTGDLREEQMKEQEAQRNVTKDQAKLNNDIGVSFPTFHCEEVGDDDKPSVTVPGGTDPRGRTRSFILHYKSIRGTFFIPFVVGLVKEVAVRYCDTTVIDMLLLNRQGEDGHEFTSWKVSTMSNSSSNDSGVATKTEFLQPPHKGEDKSASSFNIRDDDKEGEEVVAVATTVCPFSGMKMLSPAEDHDESRQEGQFAKKFGHESLLAGRQSSPSKSDIGDDDTLQVKRSDSRGDVGDHKMDDDAHTTIWRRVEEAGDKGRKPFAPSLSGCEESLVLPVAASASGAARSKNSHANDCVLPPPKKENTTGAAAISTATAAAALSSAFLLKRQTLSSGGLSGEQVKSMFPFHLIVNRRFEVTHMGNSVTQYIPGISVGSSVCDIFSLQLRDDPCKWRWEDMLSKKDASVLLETLEPVVTCAANNPLTGDKDLFGSTLQGTRQLVGGMYILSDNDDRGDERKTQEGRRADDDEDDDDDSLFSVMFLVQPNVRCFADMIDCDLKFSDLPKHSMQSQLIYLTENLQTEAYIIEKSREEAENTRRVLEMKRTFVRYVSHEIRTPLNTVFMGLRLIQGFNYKIKHNEQHSRAFASRDDFRPEKLLDEIFEMVEEVQESCDIAVSILDDLLLYEKLEGNILKLDRERHPAVSLVHATAKTFLLQARQSGLQLECTFDGDCFPSAELESPTVFIDVDKAKVSQVIRNLLSNALKFSCSSASDTTDHNCVAQSASTASFSSAKSGDRKKSKVIVHVSTYTEDSTATAARAHSRRSSSALGSRQSSSEDIRRHQPKRFVRMQVLDSGPGISPENQELLFSQIVQFNPSKLQGGRGSGLGLFISKGIMDMHGGHIGVYSEGEGRGACFFVDFPISEGIDIKTPVDDHSGGYAVGFDFAGTPSYALSLSASLGHNMSKAQSHSSGSTPLPAALSSSNRNVSFSSSSNPSPSAGISRNISSMVLAEWRREGYHNSVQVKGAAGAGTESPRVVATRCDSFLATVPEENLRHQAASKSPFGRLNHVAGSLGATPLRSLPAEGRTNCNSPMNQVTILDSESESVRPESVRARTPRGVTEECAIHESLGNDIMSRTPVLSRLRGSVEELLPTPSATHPSFQGTVPRPRAFQRNASSYDRKGASSDTSEVVPFQQRRPADLNILVVDDSLATCKMIARCLKVGQLCLAPVEASDGLEACRLLEASLGVKSEESSSACPPRYFDAVLMDFVMPVMDGPTAAKRMRAAGYEGLIIGLTGNVLPEDIAYYKGCGADEVLTKPADMQLLSSLLRNIPPRGPQSGLLQSRNLGDGDSFVADFGSRSTSSGRHALQSSFSPMMSAPMSIAERSEYQTKFKVLPSSRGATDAVVPFVDENTGPQVSVAAAHPSNLPDPIRGRADLMATPRPAAVPDFEQLTNSTNGDRVATEREVLSGGEQSSAAASRFMRSTEIAATCIGAEGGRDDTTGSSPRASSRAGALSNANLGIEQLMDFDDKSMGLYLSPLPVRSTNSPPAPTTEANNISQGGAMVQGGVYDTRVVTTRGRGGSHEANQNAIIDEPTVSTSGKVKYERRNLLPREASFRVAPLPLIERVGEGEELRSPARLLRRSSSSSANGMGLDVLGQSAGGIATTAAAVLAQRRPSGDPSNHDHHIPVTRNRGVVSSLRRWVSGLHESFGFWVSSNPSFSGSSSERRRGPQSEQPSFRSSRWRKGRGLSFRGSNFLSLRVLPPDPEPSLNPRAASARHAGGRGATQEPGQPLPRGAVTRGSSRGSHSSMGSAGQPDLFPLDGR